MLTQELIPRRKSAFTLIELLVVIAIIAILAAILFPVFAQAKLAAKKTAGLAQMKQIGTAAALYGGDNDDGLPTWSTTWTDYSCQGTGTQAALCGNVGLAISEDNMHPEAYWDYKLAPYVKNGELVKLNANGTVASVEYGGLWKSPGAEYDPKRGRSIAINQMLIWDITKGMSGASVVNSTNIKSGAYRFPTSNILDTPADTVFVADGGMTGKYDPPYYNGGGYDQKWFPSTVPIGNEGYGCEPSKGDICRAAPWRYGSDSANYVYADSHAKNEKGDKMWPNPGHKFGPFNTWPATAVNQDICAARKYFAASAAEKDLLNSKVAGGCPN